MSTDIASLGISLDSRQVVQGTAALDNLAESAGKASDATQDLSATAGKSESVIRAMESAAKRLNIPLADYASKMANAVKATNDNVAAGGSLVASLAKTATSYNGISIVLQALTAAAAIYHAATESNAPTIEASLKEQHRLVGLIKDAYHDAADKAGTFYAQSKAVVTLQLEQTARSLQDNIRSQSGQFISGNIGMRSDTDAMGNSLGTGQLDISEKYRAFAKDIRDFNASIGEGAPAVERFRDAVAAIGNANPALAKLAADLLRDSQALSEVADKWKEAQRAIRVNNGTATADDRAGLGLSNKVPQQQYNPFNAAVDSVNRHIAAMKADAQAVDATAGEHVRLRVEAQLLEAAQRKGGVITAEQTAEMKRLGQAAGEAGSDLAKARVDSEIKFGKATAFMSAEDVQIARQLKDIYPDVATALDSVQAAALRTNAAMRAGSEAFQSSANSALTDYETGAKSAADATRDFEKQFIRSLLNMANQALIIKPLLSAFGGLNSAGGVASLFSFLKGGGASTEATAFAGGMTPMAKGGAFDGGNVIPFSRGGVFNSPTLFKFASGGALNDGVLGEAGPEAIMPLSRGAGGKLGVQVHGGSAARVGDINMGDTHITIAGDLDGRQTLEALKRAVIDIKKNQVDQVKQALSDRRFATSGVR